MRSVSQRLLIAAILAAFTTVPAAAQVLSATPQTVNLGDMGQREMRDVQIVLTNSGAEELVIDDVEAECGCTVPNLESKRLAPGASTSLAIRFDSKLFIGPVIKKVLVHTNDPVNPVTEIRINARISAPLILEPSRRKVGFPDGPTGQLQERAVVFTATTIPELKLEVKGTAKGLFQVNTVNNIDGDPRRAKLEVRTPTDMPWGLNRDNVRVTTNVPEMPTVDIELSARTIAIINVMPMSLNMRFQKKFSEQIRLVPRDRGLKFKVISAETDLPNCTIEVDVRIPNQEILINLKGKPVAAQHPLAQETGGRIKGSVTIHTDVEEFPLIEVPVTYMVRM